jgi:putative heme transporter
VPDRDDLDFPQTGGGRAVLWAAACLGLAAVAFLLISKAAHVADIAGALGRGNWRWAPVLLLGQCAAYLGYALAYQGTARVMEGPRLPLWLTLRIVATGFGAFVVATSVGGLAVDYWALRRAGARRHAAIARVLALNTLEWAVLGLAAAVAGALVVTGLATGPARWMAIAWLVVVPACYAGGIAFTYPRRMQGFIRDRSGGRIRNVFADALAGVVIVRRILRNPVTHAAAWGGAAIYWIGTLVCLWAGLAAYGVHAGIAALVLGYATGYAATILPLPAGGAGGVDAAMVYSLHASGIELKPALFGVAAYRLFAFWLPIIPGILAAAGLRGIREELPEVVHPARDRDARAGETA